MLSSPDKHDKRFQLQRVSLVFGIVAIYLCGQNPPQRREYPCTDQRWTCVYSSVELVAPRSSQKSLTEVVLEIWWRGTCGGDRRWIHCGGHVCAHGCLPETEGRGSMRSQDTDICTPTADGHAIHSAPIQHNVNSNCALTSGRACMHPYSLTTGLDPPHAASVDGR